MVRKKHGIEFVLNYFLKFGYTCLETVYVNTRTKMRYICKEGHEDSMTFTNFYNNNARCPSCAGCKKYTIGFIINYFAKLGYTCLETVYVNIRTKMRYICPRDHKNSMTFGSFSNNNRCPECSSNKKHDIDFVKNYFAKFGYSCLEMDYVNAHTQMRYICDEGHNNSTTFNSFYSAGKRCPDCNGNEKHTIEFVIKYMLSFGYKCLETAYINNRAKMKYICDEGHKNSISFLNFYNNGNRCPKCVNKTEQIVNKFLEENYSNVITQKKFEWCKNKRSLPFDFLLDDLKLLLEVDGPQHFIQISNWVNPEETQKRDIFKMRVALEQGYSVIRISQVDIYNNTIDWEEMLKNIIKKYEQPICLYISKNQELYHNHKLLL